MFQAAGIMWFLFIIAYKSQYNLCMFKKSLFPFMLILLISGCSYRIKGKNADPPEGRQVVADSGMVVSAHPESSRIGIRILKRGGNAIDAAVATEFALAVCYPEAGNIGGGGFMIIRTSAGKTDMIDYREKAPQKASEGMYLDSSGNVIEGLSTETHLSSGVPGSVDGMLSIHAQYGILPFRTVIQPAIDLARSGFPVTREQAQDLNNNREQFIKKNRRLPAFVKESPWKEGDTLRQADLAVTLERIRDHGREGFYSGVNGRLIIKEMERGNGIISKEDLAGYRSVFRTPLTGNYRGFTIITVSPPSGGGIILLQILGMIEPFNLSKMGFHSASAIHVIAEAEKRAFADRAGFSGDPDFISVPVGQLLDQRYLNSRMQDFDPLRATPSSEIKEGEPAAIESEETTHYSVTDCMGNAVAATTTLNNTFGSSIVVDSAGFLLNDQMDDFSAKPGYPNMYGLIGGEANAIKPGKRMLSSMTPVIVERDGRLFLVAGSPGGSTIPTTVLQVVTNLIDYRMNIAEAVDTGRFHHQWLPDYITYERKSIDSLNLARLEKLGYRMEPRNAIGRVNAILITPGNRFESGADPRGNNSACGY
jgi:gamma-glutamyltranspeptidase/glutathione hydrolase